MANLDWDNIESEMGGNYKKFYADGKYTAKCDGVEIKDVGQNGSTIMKFHFEETSEAQYPTADHWLSWNNDNWRAWHNKCLMVVLGATDAAAKKAVEVCESKDGKDAKVKAYDATYKKLLAKKPTVEIEVYTENNYARAEFLDRSVNMNNGNKKEDKKPTETIVEEGEEIELDSLPF